MNAKIKWKLANKFASQFSHFSDATLFHTSLKSFCDFKSDSGTVKNVITTVVANIEICLTV